MTPDTMPDHIRAAFDADPRIVRVREFHDGWVANSYRYPAPGSCDDWSRDGSVTHHAYDRKRAYGQGPRIIGYSARGGRLLSRNLI